MANGGKRPGAGRKKGSTVRPALRDFYTPAELKAFVQSLKDRAATDPTIAKFVAEQIFGKAPQPLTGEGGTGPIAVQISEAIAKKNNIGV
jgi:hypothetical protein